MCRMQGQIHCKRYFLIDTTAQWARTPKKLAKIQISTGSLFITFMYAKTSLSSKNKCDFVSLFNFKLKKTI
jgi:hypothetical protein